jgi:hypothetical protein
MDLGHSDPFALEVFAYSLTSKTLFHVYEFSKKGMYAKTVAEHLLGSELNHHKPSGIIGVTGWPDAMVADTAGLGGMLLEELSNVYGVRIEGAEKKNKHDAIELFNGDLIDGRIKILKGSELEKQLMHLQWDVDDVGRLKEPKKDRNDCTDAAVYCRRKAMHLFAGDPAKPPPAHGSPMALDQRMKDDEDRAAGLHRNEFDWLAEGQYDDSLFGNG